ncbi:MAG TPA: hypothetical protein VIW72_04200 [Burkholderiales bacterium]
MQNHYVGDFGKYGLLRGIFQKSSACKLGIIWYIVSDNRHKDIKNRIEAFMKTSWEKHFECYWEFGI